MVFRTSPYAFRIWTAARENVSLDICRQRRSWSTNIIIGYNKMYEWIAKPGIILCKCAGWSKSAHFVFVRSHLFAWRDPSDDLTCSVLKVWKYIWDGTSHVNHWIMPKASMEVKAVNRIYWRANWSHIAAFCGRNQAMWNKLVNMFTANVIISLWSDFKITFNSINYCPVNYLSSLFDKVWFNYNFP